MQEKCFRGRKSVSYRNGVGQALEERQFDRLGECNSVMISAAAAGWRGIGGTSVRQTGRLQ